MGRLWAVVFILHSALVSPACKTTFSYRPLQGYYCKINNKENEIIKAGLLRHQCVVLCMSTPGCIAVSYNSGNKYCQLGLQLCDQVEPHSEFSVELYIGNRASCVQWEITFSVSTGSVSTYGVGNSVSIAVARQIWRGGVYPGVFQMFVPYYVNSAVNHTTFISNDGIREYLAFPTGCRHVWVNFTSPGQLPHGAVSGGSTPDGEELIIARAAFQDPNSIGMFQLSIGYYQVSMQTGYFVLYDAVQSTVVMELLVLL